jgi:hypothetical protein
MKLFTNGCSFTWGGQIIENNFNLPSYKFRYDNLDSEYNKFRKENIWPYHLHNLLQSDELINLSIGAGSNHRIVRTTFDFFLEKIKNKENLDDYIAIIQWTDISRYEIFDQDVNDFLLIHSYNIFPEVPDHKKELYNYKFFCHPKTFESEYKIHLISLHNFFKNNNIKYLFCTLQPFEITDDYIASMNWLGLNPKDNQILNTENFRYESGHPDLMGHKIISKRLHKRLKELYNIN